MSEYLCVEGFLEALKDFLSTFLQIKFSCALELAKCLNVEQELRLNSEKQLMSRLITKEDNEVISYKYLNYATESNTFWEHNVTEIQRDLWRSFVWDTFKMKQNLVIACALQNAPHFAEMKSLLGNMKLQNFHLTDVEDLFNIADRVQKKVFLHAVKSHVSEQLERMRNAIKFVRFSFVEGYERENKNYGILEFDTDTWTWQMNTFQHPLLPGYCVMHRDYATFLGDTGILYKRRKLPVPKFVENAYVGDILSHIRSVEKGPDFWSSWEVAGCVNGRFLYILSMYEDLDFPTFLWQPMLFKVDVFTNEFEECSPVPVKFAEITASGNLVYIAGTDINNPTINVYTFNTMTKELAQNARANLNQVDQESVCHVLLKKRLLYVFLETCYVLVDTTKRSVDITEVKRLEGDIIDLWGRKIRSVISVPDGIILLMESDYRCQNDYQRLRYFITHLDTKSNICTCLGFLPAMKIDYPRKHESYRYFLNFQIETRKLKDAPIKSTKEIQERMSNLNREEPVTWEVSCVSNIFIMVTGIMFLIS